MWGNCVGSFVGQCVGLRGGTVWVGRWCCARERCVGACTPVTRWSSHTQLPPVLPAQGGFPTTLSPIQPLPPSVPAHSSSQVVQCRVCPPHSLHAPVLALHLAVYPASPTEGRVDSLTGCHTVHRHRATRPDEVCQSLKYLVRQGSEVCFNTLMKKFIY